MTDAPAWLEELAWPAGGLLPAVAQDATTGQLLTLAWQNREALARTWATGLVHYYSRSRQALWQKGETSGNTQRVVEIRIDCDLDAVLMLVEPAGPACHTGRPSCFFHRAADGSQPLVAEAGNPWPGGTILNRLAGVIEDRVHSTGDKSYTRSLLDDPAKAAAKVTEEAGELLEAAAGEGQGRVVAEAADLLFHMLVLARTRGVDWKRIGQELERRFGTGGHEEKASRNP